MANLNFQQPPRSIANASLTGRTTGGFGGSSLSGHVTPTSGMFPTSNTNYGQTQQTQLSPNRNAQLSVGGPAQLSSGRPNMFGQRPFVERRGMQGGLSGGNGGPMSNMGNFMQAARSGTGGYGAGGIGGGLGGIGGGVTGGPINNFHNAFSGGGDANPLLDPSEFPSLSNVRGQNDSSLPQTNPLQPPGSKPYVGMVKQPITEQSEFTMSNEDFPALPGTTQNADGTTTTTPTTNNIGLTMENNLIDGATMEKTLNALAAASNSNSVIGSSVGIGSGISNSSHSSGNSGLGAVGSSVSVSGGNSSLSSIGGIQHVTSTSSNSNNNNNSNSSGNSSTSSCTTLNNSLGIVGSGSNNAIGSGSGAGNVNMTTSSGSQQIMQNLISGNNSILSGMTVGGNNSNNNNNNNNNQNNNNNTVSILSTPGNGNNSLNSNNNNSLTLNTSSNSNNSNNTINNSGNIGGNAMVMNAIGAITSNNNNSSNNSSSSSNNIDYASNENNSSNDKLVRVGVHTHPDGKVTNIPTSMVNNQFGMVGLLTFIRAAETDQNLVTLALGTDLTGLGLNLNSQESLHPTFAGPFADHPCRAQDVEYNVPHEYLINFAIRDKLATPVLKKLQDDLLFFLFYTNIGDIMQLMAAAELHSREWRYHIEEKIWITRIPGINQYEKNGTKERGTFYYFDAQSWKRLSKVFQIDAEKLDKCPNISSFGQSV